MNNSISVGIVAYNEDNNIQKMLTSVLQQKQIGFVIKEIIIISDGSTDKTVQKVKAFKDKRLKLYEFRKRIGKSSHLNTIFQKTNSDIVVLFDADVLLANQDTIYHLIQPLLKTDVVFVGGNPQPIPGTSLIEKAVNVSFKPYDQIRTYLNDGNNPYGCDGRILALNKKFYKTVYIPENMIANDNYMYFACITAGYSFKHVRDAVVYFKSPSTLTDQIRQNKRFIAARKRMRRIFGPKVSEAYAIPTLMKYKYMLLQCIKNPFLSLLIYCINKYCSYKAYEDERTMTAKWEIAETTKVNIRV